MFEIGWSELLVIGVVALIVVGPKELPILLRTIGKYVGLIKRQAEEFRAQFAEAMQQAELDQLRKDVSDIKSGAEETLRDVKRSFDEGFEDKPLASTDTSPSEAPDAAKLVQGPPDPAEDFEAWNRRILKAEAAAKGDVPHLNGVETVPAAGERTHANSTGDTAPESGASHPAAKSEA